MGKTILTPKQRDFLECVQAQPSITKRFYFTGGTALSEFYLKHRLSEDIDLFTQEHEVNQVAIHSFLKKKSPLLGVKTIKESQFLGLYSFKLIYAGGEELKVDFNYYPFLRIEKGVTYNNLDVDSIYDIAVNKVHTLFMKPRTRDYIDIYFILKKEKYPMHKLLLDAKAKFDWHIDPINLASQFTKVTDLRGQDFPAMLVPFDRNAMEEFFLAEAKKLEKDIFKRG